MPQPGSGFPRVCFVCFEDVFPSLCRQNGKKKLPSFFGMDGGQERDTTTDKILQYIPAKASANTSSPLPAAPGVYSRPPRAEHSGGTSGLGLGVAAALSQRRWSPGRDEPLPAAEFPAQGPCAGVEGAWVRQEL